MSRSYEIGSGSRACICIQSAFGTPSTSNPILMNMRNESIAKTVTKETEETLLASRTATESVLTGVQVQGNISCFLKPEMKDIFELALGKGTSGGTYTLADPDDDCVYFTLYIERGSSIYRYQNCTVQSLSLQADAQRTVSADLSIRGYDESIVQTFPTVTAFAKHSYKCTEAYLKKGTGSSAVTLAVETLNLNVNNNLVSAPITYNSGLYVEESAFGTRNIGLSFTLPYGSDYKNIADAMESDGTVSFELQFTNGGEDYVKVTMPYVSIQSSNANVSGSGLINGSINGICLSIGSTEPITVIAGSFPTN